MAMDQNNLWTGFQMPRRLAADAETLTERYGRFSAQPFERGFGTTVGNSLRRALLSSIEGDADVEILDPSVHIATVSDGGSLQIEMRLKRGRGYVSADRNFDEDLSLGYIPIDSVHTPVKKVNYNVEAARLGQNTEFDKLTIEVWTDGSVKPEDSIGLAAKLIKDHMSIFINFEEDTDDFAYTKME